MKIINPFVLFVSCLLVLSCEKKNDAFPLEKRYWDVEDYKSVVLELKYRNNPDEKLPNLNDPETKPIVEKLTDQENFKVILDDDKLGLKHKNEVADEFFDIWKDMLPIYNAMDREDKYIYEMEYLNTFKFGLALQLRYFKLGNENVIENADDKEDPSTKSNLDKNVAVLINNYEYYLDEVDNEKAFSQNGLKSYAEGIDTYFSELLKLHPNSDYSGMKTKVEKMIKKAKSPEIIASLTKLQSLFPADKTE
jgi:hypothetical protein